MTLDLFPTAGHDPGGQRKPLPVGITRAIAIYDGPGDCYRYRLTWAWDSGPSLLAGMMNPSTATERNSDATLSWVYRWAVRNGFGSMAVVNADAYRCTDQARLAEVTDPCGPDNLVHIREAGHAADMIVVGYGKPKVRAVRDHGPRMVEALRSAGKPIHVWGLSLDGTPKHPLYLLACVEAQAWIPAMEGAAA